MNPPGQIISFYSYKGGVGRSMALANVAAQLAQAGKSVWVIDFDLEAPGLHRYFLKSTPDRYRAPAAQAGTIELFTDLRARLDAEFLAEGALDKDLAAGGQRVRASVSSLLGEERFRYTVRVNNPNTRPATHAELAFTSAGHFDGGYPERVRRFDWQDFYDAYAEVFPILAEELRRRFDYVLIDSRTGITDTGSVCTVLLPDKLVLCFTTNEQSLHGAVELGQQVVLQRAQLEPARPLGLFPLPLRLENAEQELQRRFMKDAKERFEQAFRASYRLEQCDLTTYFQICRVRHDSFYAYGEEIAAERDASVVTGSLAEAFVVFRAMLNAPTALEVEVSGRVVSDLDESSSEHEASAMGLQALFTRFHEQIKLKDTEDDLWLRQLRDQVLDHLRLAMWERHRLRMTLFNSGSYAMGTGVQPLPGADIDIDVGIFFSLEHSRQDAHTVKEWVYRALPSSLGRIEWRRRCLTVFSKDYHVNLGIYARDDGGLWLAVGKEQDPGAWQQDGIQLFIHDVRDRFMTFPADHAQFQRTIRYLKRWKDVNFQGQGVMAPLGLALTVMAYSWFSPRRRAGDHDDLAALTDLVRRVLERLGPELPFPQAPGDNLLRKLSAEQVLQMRGRFEKLLALLEQARTSGSAAPLRRAFGPDFPES